VAKRSKTPASRPAAKKKAKAKPSGASRPPTTKKVVDAIEKALKQAEAHQGGKPARSKKLDKAIRELKKMQARAMAMCDPGFSVPG
jgi:hypothetical protein